MDSNYWTGRRVTRRTVLRGSAVGVLGLAGAALIGCGSDKGGDKPATVADGKAAPAQAPLTFKRGGIVRMGTPALSTGLDPTFSGAGYHKTALAFDTLLGIGADGLATVRDDALASSIEQVDKTTIVMKLRPGVKFHDGTPFNAQSVVWNVGRTLQPKPPAALPHKAQVQYVSKVEAVDDTTVRWILKQPDAGILTAFTDTSCQMLSPTHYEGKSLADVMWRPVGTGRYMFKEYSADAFVKYRVNPDYFQKLADGGPAGMVDEIHELAIPDAIARAASLQAGNLEVLDESPATQLDLLNADKNLLGVKAEGFAIRNAYINHDLAPLNNVNFRRALAWAWDPVAQNNVFDNGIGKPATSALGSLSWAHIDVPDFPMFDLKKAATFLEASGVPKAERKVLITGDTLYFQFLQDAWAKIGVTAEYVKDATNRLNKNAGAKNPDVHMSVGSRITSRQDPGWQLGAMLRSDSIYNYGLASTGAINDLTDKGQATYDIKERKAIYAEVQKIAADQQYSMFYKVEIPFWVHTRKPLQGARHFGTGRGDYRYLNFSA